MNTSKTRHLSAALVATSATDTGPICPGMQFEPGSPQVLMAAKAPWLLSHRDCLKSGG